MQALPPLPKLMQSSHGLTAVYIKQLLKQLAFSPAEQRQLEARSLIDFARIERDPFYRIPLYKLLCLLDRPELDRSRLLAAAARLRIKSFPVLGYAVISSANLDSALQRLIELELLVWDVGNIQLQRGEEVSQLIWRSELTLPPVIVEIALLGWTHIGRQLFTREYRQARLQFHHAPALPLEEYKNLFGVSTAFNADDNCISFPSDWLEERLLDRDKLLADVMADKARHYLQAYPNKLNIENTLRSHIFRHLPQEPPALDTLAKRLNESPRQLLYQLKTKGLSYRGIVDDVRKEAAVYFLQQAPKASLAEIAQACGFAEQSSFNRAFRRWFSCAPSAMRASTETVATHTAQ